MTVEVDFRVTHDKRQLTSAEALREAAELSEDFERPWDLEGVWTVRSDEVEIAWEDTLVPLISATCLETVPALARAGHAVASRLTEYGYLRLDVEGSWIRLGGDELASGRVPARDLVQAQLGCAGRLISLLTALGMDGFDLRALKEDRRAAMEAYGSWPHDDASGPDVLGPIPDAPPRRDAEGPLILLRDPGLAVFCGGERFHFPGDPDVWLTRLTTEVAPALSADAHLVYARPDQYGWLRIDGEGDRVRLSGDGLVDLRVPRAAFEGALRAVVLA